MTQSVPFAAPAAARHHSPGLVAQDRFLRMHQVCEMCGLSRSAIYGRIKLGLFPAQVQLGPKSVAWLASDISNWMQTRIAARNH
ncbi:helix-turn-helix transcriptional regulator [Bordetella bronchiseptica]|uniref:helix-turn-helix transcriptional regulator n=1 Tax=Bordetella bronchiseptica TaxID=518 RepID=UPI001F473BCA|nr:AlpA family transcriptional regulator [Bordetella bronchiseptica]